MIKAIAVDKDGTFLRSDHTYDVEYFDSLFEKIIQQDIKFIVASGNQYAQLRTFFSEKIQHITFVAENGAVTYHNDELLTAHYFNQQLIFDVLNTINQDYHIRDIVLCGIHSAYINDQCSDEFLKFIQNYYYNIDKVSSFSEIKNERFVKIALRIKDKALVEKVMNELEQKYKGELRAVTSGNDSVDLILPKVHKGVAIKEQLNKWGIHQDELLAFGDANNDIEMLELTQCSYAMANCSPELASIAKYRAPSNDDSGVLRVIEQYL
ncbi:Cof-type HAD-IIB family hydrolase [Staphylococcus edaphicus]|uniref:Hydrolase n=1 Tax=Staphylococcus edaphicus TaxID=1955013 RepID=A0A2C6WCC9_9STAP|nr:Cof-type HAD-IIB family hydrolase [Staphylococcus edaphicus]PHK48528.1 hydrolase [Staphylococcus edaphicus]UQW81837.1 Cof-type HAD-IIB family hydrolase [Staphylococcus edaphicus]